MGLFAGSADRPTVQQQELLTSGSDCRDEGQQHEKTTTETGRPVLHLCSTLQLVVIETDRKPSYSVMEAAGSAERATTKSSFDLLWRDYRLLWTV